MSAPAPAPFEFFKVGDRVRLDPRLCMGDIAVIEHINRANEFCYLEVEVQGVKRNLRTSDVTPLSPRLSPEITDQFIASICQHDLVQRIAVDRRVRDRRIKLSKLVQETQIFEKIALCDRAQPVHGAKLYIRRVFDLIRGESEQEYQSMLKLIPLVFSLYENLSESDFGKAISSCKTLTEAHKTIESIAIELFDHLTPPSPDLRALSAAKPGTPPGGADFAAQSDEKVEDQPQ